MNSVAGEPWQRLRWVLKHNGRISNSYAERIDGRTVYSRFKGRGTDLSKLNNRWSTPIHQEVSTSPERVLDGLGTISPTGCRQQALELERALKTVTGTP